MIINSVSPISYKGIFRRTPKPPSPITYEQATEIFPKYTRKITDAIWIGNSLYEKGQQNGWKDFFDEETQTQVSFQRFDFHNCPKRMFQKDKDGNIIRQYRYSIPKEFSQTGHLYIEIKDDEGKPLTADVAFNDIDMVVPNYTINDMENKRYAEVKYHVDNEDNDFCYIVDACSNEGRRFFRFYSDIPLINPD